jgi:hypothetical protein
LEPDASRLEPAPSQTNTSASVVDSSETQATEVYLIQLDSGKFFWSPADNGLYGAISEDEPGELVGQLKLVTIRGSQYYNNTLDGALYAYVSENEIGERVGKIDKVSRRATFDRKK